MSDLDPDYSAIISKSVSSLQDSHCPDGRQPESRPENLERQPCSHTQALLHPKTSLLDLNLKTTTPKVERSKSYPQDTTIRKVSPSRWQEHHRLRCQCRISFQYSLSRSPSCRYSALTQAFRDDSDLEIRRLPPLAKTAESPERDKTLPKARKSHRCICHIFIEARAVHRVAPDGSLVREDRSASKIQKIPLCSRILEVAPHVLQSGIALYLGQWVIPCIRYATLV